MIISWLEEVNIDSGTSGEGGINAVKLNTLKLQSYSVRLLLLAKSCYSNIV